MAKRGPGLVNNRGSKSRAPGLVNNRSPKGGGLIDSRGRRAPGLVDSRTKDEYPTGGDYALQGMTMPMRSGMTMAPPVAKGKGKRAKGGGGTIGEDFNTSAGLYDNIFGFGDLPRIQDQFAQDTEDSLSKRREYSDPRSAAFAGRRSGDISDILGKLKGGLDGYSAAENNALSEQMNRNVDTDLSNTLAKLKSSNASNMVLGGAAVAREDGARAAADKTRAQNEQDLFVKNVDEKQNRLNNYSGQVSAAENNESAKGQEAIANYEKMLADARANSLGIQAQNIELEKADRAARVGAIGGFADMIQNRRAERNQTNMTNKYFARR
jgi:hypothetical protein